MFRLKDAEAIKMYLDEVGKILYKSNVNIFGRKEVVFLYKNEEEKIKHIQEMVLRGWQYEENMQQTFEGLYTNIYDSTNDIYVCRAWFYVDEDTDFLKWYKDNRLKWKDGV